MAKEQSLFQQKYNEFVNDLLGALPEYTQEIQVASALGDAERVTEFKDVAVGHSTEDKANPQKILPGVTVSDTVWESLSENTQKAIWEHLRLVSMCYMMETGFDAATTEAAPSWMDDAMKDMKDKLDSDEFQSMMKKFMGIFGSKKDDDDATDAGDAAAAGASKAGASIPNFGSFFEKGMPKLPERFLNGHLVRLAQEIVKDIKPEDLGLDPEMMAECEKEPSRAFSMLFATFKNKPEVIQKVIAKVGNRIQHKIKTGAIRMEEIAREAEELIKEFADNPAFVEMMDGIKKAFGFEDMGLAKKAGKESSARLSMVRDRLRKKLDKKKQGKM